MSADILRHWPGETRTVAALIPYARNSRTHSDQQVGQLAGAIREFGWTNPVLIDEEESIIAGHGRLLAAAKLGMAMVPIIILRGLSEAQKRALRIADNKLPLNAGWDNEMLRLELDDLAADAFDLSVLGFDDTELEAIYAPPANEGDGDPDEGAGHSPPENPVSRPGDLWQLGRHRLICGSSTEAHVVERLLGDAKPHLMITDPPYGVNYDPLWRGEAARKGGLRHTVGNESKGKVQNDDRADWREAWALFPGDVAYVWHGALHSGAVEESLKAANFQLRSQIIWAKQALIISRGDYHWKHESCWYAVRKGGTGHWQGDRKQSTVWEINTRMGFYEKDNEAPTGHGTQKPVECMRRPIINNSSAGQAIYDPFVGSGTTIIAAEMTGRVAYACELDPAYVDVIVARWQKFAGATAILDGDGRSFAEVSEAEPRPGLEKVVAGTVVHERQAEAA